MNLGRLIEILEVENPDKVIKDGFHKPHSHRWDYRELAFEPKQNARIGDMLKCAKDSLGQSFQGYKGGDFHMDEYTTVCIANYGSCGEEIPEMLLKLLLEREVK